MKAGPILKNIVENVEPALLVDALATIRDGAVEMGEPRQGDGTYNVDVRVEGVRVFTSAEMRRDGTMALVTWCRDHGTDKCVHAMAAILTVAGELEDTTHGERASTMALPSWVAPPAPVLEPWERALGRVLDTGAPDDIDTIDQVALLFSVRAKEPGEPRTRGIAIRPAVRGARGQWVRSRLRWADVEHEALPEHQASALGELLALWRSHINFDASAARYDHRMPYLSTWSAPDWIRLDVIPSRSLWALLNEAAQAGVAFVADDREQGAVPLRTPPYAARIDARLSKGRLRVAAEFQPEEEGISSLDGESFLPIGVPTVGLARVGQDGTVRDLVPLAAPVAVEFDELRKKPLSIPRASIPVFEHDYLPRLRRLGEVVSGDGSYDVPQPEPPTLLLTITRHDERLALAWRWTYADGGMLRLPLAERTIQDRVVTASGTRSQLLGTPTTTVPFPRRLLDQAQTVEFLAEVLPALREVESLRIEEPDDLPAYRMAQVAPLVELGAHRASNDWFDLEIAVSVGGEQVPFVALFAALASGQAYFALPSGTVFPLLGEEFAVLRRIIEEARALSDRPIESLRLSRYDADLWRELCELGIVEAQKNTWLDALRALSDADELESRPVPAGFGAELREYQQVGYSWLSFLRRHELGGILADDMGLGKTVQALAMLGETHADEPKEKFLVVTPTSVVGHWVASAKQFTPSMTAIGIDRTSGKRGRPLGEAIGDASLVVTSYAIFRLDFDEFQAAGFRILLLDEAQQIKNHQSRGYKCARMLDAPTKIAISGTPMENNLTELWALASLVAPGLLGGVQHFSDTYRKPIEREGSALQLQRLRRRLKPFLLRRTKEEVALDLPQKTEQVLEVELTSAHRKLYITRLQRERAKVLGMLDDVESNRFEILKSLTTLRQLALDPSLIDETSDVPSAKLTALGDLLEEVVAEGHRVLVFSQFTQFLGRAAAVAEERGIGFAYLDGSVPQARRQRMIDRFREGGVPVFFISIKAGGTGLTLTEADYCVLLDPWWNPQVEAQAVDRAHRIGQQRSVFVYRMISVGTIEEKVMSLQQRKAKLFSDVLGSDDVTAAAALTADDFRVLIDDIPSGC
ncbi:MAG: DEAD/DEAH box helicase [Microbacterium sp.]